MAREIKKYFVFLDHSNVHTFLMVSSSSLTLCSWPQVLCILLAHSSQVCGLEVAEKTLAQIEYLSTVVQGLYQVTQKQKIRNKIQNSSSKISTQYFQYSLSVEKHTSLHFLKFFPLLATLKTAETRWFVIYGFKDGQQEKNAASALAKGFLSNNY